MSNIIYFIRYALEFVMPDQLRALAHTCRLARDEIILLKCREVERVPETGYASQTTVVRMLKYSSLTGLMYCASKRASFLHFIVSNIDIAFGFACHNDDLELAQYIDHMLLRRDDNFVWYTWDLLIFATPQLHRELAREYMYNEIHNCTPSYRIFAHLCNGSFKNITRGAEHIEEDYALSCIATCAIHSEYTAFTNIALRELHAIALQNELDKYLAYKCGHISREMMEYLRSYDWFMTWRAERMSGKPRVIDLIWDGRARDFAVCWDDVDESCINAAFVLALSKKFYNVAKSIMDGRRIAFESFGFRYAAVMYPHYAINAHYSTLGSYDSQDLSCIVFMSEVTLRRMFPKYPSHNLRPICTDNLFECYEMYHDATDFANDVFIETQTKKLSNLSACICFTNMIEGTSHTMGQIVSPACLLRLDNIHANLANVRARNRTDEIKVMRAFFTEGVLRANVDVMRESRFAQHIASGAKYDADARILFEFILSRRYSRIYDAEPVYAFIGESGIFRNRMDILIGMRSIGAITAVMRHMPIHDITRMIEYMRKKASNAHYVIVEFIARVLMREHGLISARM